MNSLRFIYAWVLRPSNTITDKVERSRATTGTGIALVLALFTIINALFYSEHFWDPTLPGHWYDEYSTVVVVIAGVVMFLLYLLARTRFYKVAFWLLVALPTVGAFAMNLIALAQNLEGIQSYAFYYVILSPLLAMILFDTREVIWSGLINMFGLIAYLVVFNYQVTTYGATDAFFFPVAIIPIIMFAAYYWSRLEGKRRTELEHLLDQSQKLQAQAEEANRLKTEFLTIVSHELRTPLNSIIGYSDLMLKGIGVEGPPLSDDSAYLTGRIKYNGKHLLHIINDILDVSKIEAKRVQVANEPFSPHALMDWTLAELKPFADEKHLRLITTMDTDLPQTIVGDENLLRRILVNLGSNAIKFTKEGSVTIAILRRGDVWQIRVTDTGIGIPADMREIIFQPFRQVDGSYQRQVGGTGLGLTICRNLAHLMDGDIQLESEEGRGSTFTVTLPLTVQPAVINYTMEGTAL